MSRIVGGGTVCGKDEQRQGEKKTDGHWGFEGSIHFELLSS
jgi:hypothetical protein